MLIDEARGQLTAAVEGHGSANYRRVVDEMLKPPADLPEVVDDLRRAVDATWEARYEALKLAYAVVQRACTEQEKLTAQWRKLYETLKAKTDKPR